MYPRQLVEFVRCTLQPDSVNVFPNGGVLEFSIKIW